MNTQIWFEGWLDADLNEVKPMIRSFAMRGGCDWLDVINNCLALEVRPAAAQRFDLVYVGVTIRTSVEENGVYSIKEETKTIELKARFSGRCNHFIVVATEVK